ncbi:unnamed protein product [Absidia cylindrospora]
MGSTGVIQALQNKIIGGQQVGIDTYPFQVSLGDMRYVSRDPQQRRRQSVTNKINSHICGGVLLTKTWVVTAAHCVMDPSQSRPSVVPAGWLGVGVGSNDLVEMYDKGRIGISRIIVQPNFDQSRWMNDIALIKLDTPVDASAFRNGHYAMGCLADNSRLPSGLWSIGWGNTVPITENQATQEWTPHQPSQYLKQLTMKDISNKNEGFCQGRNDLVCVTSIQRNTGPCRGDSGGALVSSNKRTVVGVYSFMKSVPVNNNNQAMCLGDGQYTRVSSHLNWIRSHVNERFCTSHPQ